VPRATGSAIAVFATVLLLRQHVEHCCGGDALAGNSICKTTCSAVPCRHRSALPSSASRVHDALGSVTSTSSLRRGCRELKLSNNHLSGTFPNTYSSFTGLTCVPGCAALCCALLRSAALCCALLRSAALCCALLRSAALCCALMTCAVLCFDDLLLCADFWRCAPTTSWARCLLGYRRKGECRCDACAALGWFA
jgi:hypothetical protein